MCFVLLTFDTFGTFASYDTFKLVIFVNFKTYEQGSGIRAVELAKTIEQVSSETSIKIIPVVQAADLKEVTSNVKVEVWVQNIDPIEYGAHTGGVLPEAVLEDGAVGTFLNHSEHKFENFDDLEKANKRAQEVGLKTLIFAGNMEELELVLKLKPNYVSYEPPELVGSTTTSVSQAKPEVVEKAVEIAKQKSLPVIVGAGIKTEEDIRVSLQLGAAGFAIASSIVKAEDPKSKLLELTKGYN